MSTVLLILAIPLTKLIGIGLAVLLFLPLSMFFVAVADEREIRNEKARAK